MTWRKNVRCAIIAILTYNEIDWDTIFPDDGRDRSPASFKFLEKSREWRKDETSGGDASGLFRAFAAAKKAATAPAEEAEEKTDTETTKGEEEKGKSKASESDDDSDSAASSSGDE